MPWSLLVLGILSAAAGLGMGRVVSRRVRGFMFLGGVEAVLLGLGLLWLGGRTEPVLPPEMAGVLALLLFGIGAVAAPFAVGAWLARP
jgi:hypothetical protein